MKTFCIGLLLYILAGCSIHGYFVLPPDGLPPGDVLWVKQIGSSEFDSGKGIAIDSSGNLIAVGSFRQTISPDSEPATSSGEDDAYVVKMDSLAGSVIWAKRVGGKSLDSVLGVAVDASDNIYIGGSFAGSVDFGGGTLTTTSASAAFVLKLDPSGGFGWARKVDGGGIDGPGARLMPGAIATDGNSVIVVNNYSGSIIVDTATLTSAGSFDMFALKMSASTGETLWAKSFGGTSGDFATGLALDSSGNVVITGAFTGIVNFGGGLLSSSPGYDNGFLLKLASANGSHLISRKLGSTMEVHGSAVAVDAANEIFITGAYYGTADFGCAESLSDSPEGTDAFLVKYTQAGACMWVRSIGGASGKREAFAIAVSGLDDATIVGDFCGLISFDIETLSSASACGSLDVFAARFSTDGKYLGSIRTGGTSDDRGLGIAQSDDGRLFITGSFVGFSEFGRDSLTAVGDADAFIAGFAPL